MEKVYVVIGRGPCNEVYATSVYRKYEDARADYYRRRNEVEKRADLKISFKDEPDGCDLYCTFRQANSRDCGWIMLRETKIK